MTAKRRRTPTTGNRRRGRRRTDPPSVPPRPIISPPPVKNSFYNRKCKVSTLLQPNYIDYKDIFRDAAEEFSTVRSDAMNFALFMVIQWFTTQRFEIRAYQRQQVPVLQVSLQRILHETSLLNQIQQLIQQTRNLLEQEQNIPPQYQGLLDIRAEILNAFEVIRLESQQLDNLLLLLNGRNNIQGEQNNNEQERQEQNNLSLQIHLLLLNLLPQFEVLKDIAARAPNIARNIIINLEEAANVLRNQFLEDQRAILDGYKANIELERSLIALRNMYNAIIAVPQVNQSDNARIQHINQMLLSINTAQEMLTRRREIERLNEGFFQQNPAAQEYRLNIQLTFILNDILIKFVSAFQVIETTWQEVRLALKEPEYNVTFPNITNETFWSHAYRKVCLDPLNLNERINFSRSITMYFDDYNVSRKFPGTEDYLYNIPNLDILHREISHIYTGTMIQNVVMHLLSINLWVIRLFKGFLLWHQTENNVQVAVMTIAKRASSLIMNHGNIIPELQEIPGFENLFNRIKNIFDADFLGVEPDVLKSYDNAKAHPLKYLRVSYLLLREASSHDEWPVKLWSLLPGSSYRIVHVPISGFAALYGVFLRARDRNLAIPNFLLDLRGNLMGITAFSDLYVSNDKLRIWETIFNIGKLEKNCLRDFLETAGRLDIEDPLRRKKLAFGLKTDGHMVSILFEKVTLGALPHTINEVAMQRRGLDLTNLNKGIYPLYKMPVGLLEGDRIIGIDPAIRDIICAVDCAPDELTNKATVRQHSFSISNASYKLRSGMQWINQRELQSRQASGIQECYERLSSRKVATTQGLMMFLNSNSQEYTRIFNFMRAYRHRENKGYAFSNRQRALDFIGRVVAGRTTKHEPYHLSSSSCSQRNRKKRLRFRVEQAGAIRDKNDQERTIVAYGDASIRGTYRGNTPIPVKKTQRAIAFKSLVIPLDEFRTSITCCHCFARMATVPYNNFSLCNHSKKLHRSNGSDGNPLERKTTLKCYNEQGHVLHRTSTCPDRVPRNRTIYPLKICNQCLPSRNGDGLYWNRDVNAAANIREILSRYIAQGFDLNSRPPQLSRIRELNAEEEELELAEN